MRSGFDKMRITCTWKVSNFSKKKTILQTFTYTSFKIGNQLVNTWTNNSTSEYGTLGRMLNSEVVVYFFKKHGKVVEILRYFKKIMQDRRG